MKYKKSLIIICLIICLFGIASVSASDMDDTIVASESNLIKNDLNPPSSVELGNAPDGTFTDLAEEMRNSNGELNLSRNYAFSDDDFNYEEGITFNEPIIINGNGYSINGKWVDYTFKFNNQVTLNNISFIESANEFGSNVEINNCNFIKSTIKFGSNVEINNCKFINTTESIGIPVYSIGSNNTLNNCSFINSLSTNSASSIYLKGSNNTLNNCSFDNCHSVDDIVLLVDGSNNTLNNCKFNNCYSTDEGAIVYCRNTPNYTMANCSFKKCDTYKMEIIRIIGPNSKIIDCNLTDCHSTANGIVCFISANGTIANCSFKKTSGKTYHPDISANGAIYWVGDNGTLANCSFENITTKMYYDKNCYGGAIRWIGDNGIIANSTFTNTSCFSDENAAYGGAISWTGKNGNIYNCSFINSSSKSGESDSYGGAIYWESDNGTITNCSFENCSATFGGGIYFKGTNCNLIYPTFKNNTAEKGPTWYSENYLNIIIVKISTNITFSSANATYGLPEYIILTLKDVNDNVLANEQLIVILNDECYYKTTDSNGQVKIFIYGLTPGCYPMDVYYEGSDEFNPSNTTIDITVNKADTIISAKDVSLMYKDTAGKLVATLTSVYGKALGVNVNININGQNYTIKADSRGKINMPIGTLTPGTYVATISYKGNVNYNPTTTTANIIVNKANTTITAQDVILTYKGETGELLATITNEYGKPLSVNMNININGENYTLKADSKGQIKIPIETTTPANYIATISYKGNVNYNPTTTTANIIVNKANTTITAQDVSVTYKNSTGKLIAKITNEYGKPLSVNVNVNINGQTYTVKADSKGQIIIPTAGLAPGNYTATITYNGNVNYNPSTVTANVVVNKADTIITAQDVTVKYGDENGKLTATLKNAYGNGLGVNVKVNLNGQTYTIKANSKGQINIPTKDLAVGSYVATITYNGNVNYNPTSTTATITVKK